MDDWPHTIQVLAEMVIAVCAAYTAYRSKANATLTQKVQAKLEDNPKETVAEIIRSNGPLSGVLCRVPPPNKMPGE